MDKLSCHFTKLITYLSLLSIALILFYVQSSPFYSTPSSPTSRVLENNPKGFSRDIHYDDKARLVDSVTFLPLKDLRFVDTAMEGNTWFMSSLNDTRENNEAEYLHFPSELSKGRLLCIKGRNVRDGTKNSYALAWPESLPESATLLTGLTFVSDSYYVYTNLWHGVSAFAPFVGWSINKGCIKPARWVIFFRGELRTKVGAWLQHVMDATFGKIPIEGFEQGDGPYCFERATVMRHNLGKMGNEKKHKVSNQVRCKAREYCGIPPAPGGKVNEANERGDPIIRVTLLMRRGSRSFANATEVTRIFAKECAREQGCILRVAQSEDLDFCQQVRVLTYTDIVASPHGAQLVNMVFMDQNSSVMEFFPRGWLELAGVGQYALHWMANLSGLKHQGAWWDPLGDKDCPNPKNDQDCFHFYKNGKIGHNETYLSEWARTVINRVRLSKLKDMKNSAAQPQLKSRTTCVC